MQAKRLLQNGTIGIFCPSHVAIPERYAMQIAGIERMGFGVKLSENFHKDTWGYAASAEERANDFNALVADKSVDAILFNGGNAAAEILPYIDYENIRRNPKRIGSYSDGTPILNAIYAQTGLITYHGICAGDFADLRHYNYMQFCSHFVEGYEARQFASDSKWITLNGGNCEGTLIGGYTSQFGLMLANHYFRYDSNKKYLLFLESHEKYSSMGAVATYLAYIAQSEFMRNVSGLIFGHYSTNMPSDLLRCLERFGQKHNIPVVYTDDFGHGTRHAILPIGMTAKLDASNQCLSFED